MIITGRLGWSSCISRHSALQYYSSQSHSGPSQRAATCVLSSRLCMLCAYKLGPSSPAASLLSHRQPLLRLSAGRRHRKGEHRTEAINEALGPLVAPLIWARRAASLTWVTNETHKRRHLGYFGRQVNGSSGGGGGSGDYPYNSNVTRK